MNDLEVNCKSDPEDVIRFESEIDDDSQIIVGTTHCYVENSIFIDKTDAEQIVNHLIKVFDITPEQRNK